MDDPLQLGQGLGFRGWISEVYDYMYDLLSSILRDRQRLLSVHGLACKNAGAKLLLAEKRCARSSFWGTSWEYLQAGRARVCTRLDVGAPG